MATSSSQHSFVPRWLASYHASTRDPATVALITVPLALIYGLGLTIAAPSSRSGVDMVSGQLMTRLSSDGFIAVQLGAAALVVLIATVRLRRSVARRAALTLPVVGEAAAYGVLMAAGIVALLSSAHALSLGPVLLNGALVDRAVLSAGAGLWEEVLFRLLLIPILAMTLQRVFGIRPALALLVAVLTSSVAFAAAHHVAGEPFTTYAFSYRTVAGLVFALLFLARGFAVAAWSHACYDFYVLSL